MGDPSSTLIFSIDPGVVNLGVTWYDYSNRKILFADKVMLAPKLRAIKSDSEIVPRVFKLFFYGNLRKMIEKSKVVLIECQMKTKMKIIQHSIASFCFAFNFDYEMLGPKSVKSHFDTGAFARKKIGKSVKGTKNNHAANKKMAISKVNELYPELFKKVNKKKQDDIADSLLQAVYYGDRITKKRKVTSSSSSSSSASKKVKKN